MPSDTIHRPFGVFEFLEERGIGLPTPVVMLTLCGIAASEVAIFYGYVEYALWGHFITLLLCVLGPLYFENDASVFQVLALVPVFRLVNLGMPVFFELTLYWLPFVYGPFIPAGYLVVKSQRSVNLSVGWIRALIALPVAIPLSAVLGVVEYSIIRPPPLVRTWSDGNLLFVGVVVFGFVAVVEELLYRGLIQRIFENQLGRWSGLVIASILFGLMHSSYGTVNELMFATSIGLLFGVIYDYVESFLLVVLMHGTLGFFLFAVVPFHPWLVPYLYQHIPG